MFSILILVLFGAIFVLVSIDEGKKKEVLELRGEYEAGVEGAREAIKIITQDRELAERGCGLSSATHQWYDETIKNLKKFLGES